MVSRASLGIDYATKHSMCGEAVTVLVELFSLFFLPVQFRGA